MVTVFTGATHNLVTAHGKEQNDGTSMASIRMLYGNHRYTTTSHFHTLADSHNAGLCARVWQLPCVMDLSCHDQKRRNKMTTSINDKKAIWGLINEYQAIAEALLTNPTLDTYARFRRARIRAAEILEIEDSQVHAAIKSMHEWGILNG